MEATRGHIGKIERPGHKIDIDNVEAPGELMKYRKSIKLPLTRGDSRRAMILQRQSQLFAHTL